MRIMRGSRNDRCVLLAPAWPSQAPAEHRVMGPGIRGRFSKLSPASAMFCTRHPDTPPTAYSLKQQRYSHDVAVFVWLFCFPTAAGFGR